MKNKSLADCRADPEHWKALAYQAAKNPAFNNATYDAHEKQRYAVLIELQYDCQQTDEALIRFLMEQEVLAREQDSFQGMGEALMLASYLLAGFKRADDIALFWRAKCANFDTYGGYDHEFLLVALGEQTKAYAQKHLPDLFEDMDWDNEDYYGDEFQAWWSELSFSYPKSEAQEDAWVLYNRAIYFDDKNRAYHYLQKLAQQKPEVSDATLARCYAQLERWDKAIAYREQILKRQSSLWDQVSAGRDLLDLYRLNHEIKRGVQLLKSLDQQLSQFDTWKNCGLGRMTIEVGFKFILVIENREVAKRCFELVNSWQQQMKNTVYVVLIAGVEAAKHCGLDQLAQSYQQQADAERKRINGELASSCSNLKTKGSI